MHGLASPKLGFFVVFQNLYLFISQLFAELLTVLCKTLVKHWIKDVNIFR